MNHVYEFNVSPSRYKIIVGEYEEENKKMCFFVWLSSPRGGKSFTWEMGESLYATYVYEKSNINVSDLSSILSYIQYSHPTFIKHLHQFNKNYFFGV